MGFNSRMFIKSYLSCGLNRKKTQTWNRSFYLHSTTSIAGTSVVGLANFFFFLLFNIFSRWTDRKYWLSSRFLPSVLLDWSWESVVEFVFCIEGTQSRNYGLKSRKLDIWAKNSFLVLIFGTMS